MDRIQKPFQIYPFVKIKHLSIFTPESRKTTPRGWKNKLTLHRYQDHREKVGTWSKITISSAYSLETIIWYRLTCARNTYIDMEGLLLGVVGGIWPQIHQWRSWGTHGMFFQLFLTYSCGQKLFRHKNITNERFCRSGVVFGVGIRSPGGKNHQRELLDFNNWSFWARDFAFPAYFKRIFQSEMRVFQK